MIIYVKNYKTINNQIISSSCSDWATCDKSGFYYNSLYFWWV